MEDKLVEKLSLEEAKEIMPKIGFGMEKKNTCCNRST